MCVFAVIPEAGPVEARPFQQAAEKLNLPRKGDHWGSSRHTFSTAYAALKGRSFTVAPKFVSFFAAR